MVLRMISMTLAICLLYVIAIYSVQAQEQPQNEADKVEEALKLLEHLTETRKGLTALKKIVSDLDSDMQKTQKRTCAVGGGMSGHCTAAFLSNRLDMHDWLSSGMSPGKKRAFDSESPEVQKLRRKLEDLTRKRKGLEILQRILNEMEADLMYEQKRNCHFNLGGHCATESAAYVADHWHYLNSPLSPGRKRRDTGLYKKLVSGKIFQ